MQNIRNTELCLRSLEKFWKHPSYLIQVWHYDAASGADIKNEAKPSFLQTKAAAIKVHIYICEATNYSSQAAASGAEFFIDAFN